MRHSATSLTGLLSDATAHLPPVPQVDGIPATLDESGMAQLLGIGASQIRTKTRDGLLVKAGRGQWDTRASLRAYINQLRDVAGRAGRPVEGGDEYKAERTRLAKLQADRTALQNAVLRDEMLPAEQVQREWCGIMRDVRAAMLAIPSRFGAAHPHQTPHDIQQLDREIKAALEGLADASD